jgi:hypothetical protein
MDTHPLDVNFILIAVSGLFFAGIIKGAQRELDIRPALCLSSLPLLA